MASAETVAVIVATFGGDEWKEVAQEAIRSAQNQTRPPDECVHVHGESLYGARNEGARLVGTKWLIFLDADDQLDEHYIEEMLKGSGDIRRPSTLGIVDGVEDDEPVLIPERDLSTGNYIVIGAMCRRDQFFHVGGFDDYPVLEDWALWRKLTRAGATVSAIPSAVYRVNVRPNSRNQSNLHGKYFNIIRRQPG